ncbi:MAG TPA: OmpA family protein [Syntrophales bacterium]|mgnify:CR=1 FL=1|nr:OmpA family protein [Syntrophales bacterium]HRT60986.1 OmpA family protein [Syntrophales bacterium]
MFKFHSTDRRVFLSTLSSCRGQGNLFTLVFMVCLAILLYLQLQYCSPTPPPPAVKPAEKAVSEAAKALEKLGKFSAVKLPNGTEINVPEFGVERKLIAFIEDKKKPVDKTTWFTFDRLDFETGSANLKPTSAEQLKNIAAIMKAYPKAALKIGGYTDNVGKPEDNLKLSQKRAENTMQELVKAGADAKRLQAEGYGEKFPVADNSTEEGRAKNRRIDLRVTKK